MRIHREGIVGRPGGWKAQCRRGSSGVGSGGAFAPWSIQVRRTETSAGLRGVPSLSGGIRSVELGRRHPLDEQALAAPAGLDRRTAVAPAPDQIGRVQAEARLLADRSVAARASRGQDRLDLASVVNVRSRSRHEADQEGSDHGVAPFRGEGGSMPPLE